MMQTAERHTTSSLPLRDRPDGDLRIEEIRDVRRFESLETEWNALLGRTAAPNLFRTHEWMATWWRCNGAPDKRLMVLLVSDVHGLRGIAPLMEVRGRFAGMPAVKIEFLTTMRHAYSPENCSGCLDLIVPEPAEDVIRAVVRYLFEVHTGWHFLRLHPVPVSSALPRILEEECQKRGAGYRGRTVFTNFSLEVSTPWKEYEESRGAVPRKKHRLADRKLEKTGTVTLRDYGSEDLIEAGYRKILEIEKRSWKESRGIPIDAAVFHDFYRSFARLAAQRGWLKLWLLESSGHPIAYDYSVLCYRRVESLKTSYDREYRMYSPGTSLTWRIMEEYFRGGVDYINLQWGDGWSKQLWTTDVVPELELFAFAPTGYASVLRFLGLQLELYRVSRSIPNRMTDVTRFFRHRYSS